MPTSQTIDSDQIWKRVELEELRNAVKRAEYAIHQFERVLRALPSCNACARLKLIEQVQHTSGRLGKEAIGLTVLAQGLKNAMEAVDRTRSTLTQQSLAPCRCSGTECTCHE